MKTWIGIIVMAFFALACGSSGSGGSSGSEPETASDSGEGLASSEAADAGAADAAADDAAVWWKTDVEQRTGNDKDSGAKGTDDKDTDDIEDCAEGFDPEAPCEGDWMETLCAHEGLVWWCDGGVWLNETSKDEGKDDKPEPDPGAGLCANPEDGGLEESGAAEGCDVMCIVDPEPGECIADCYLEAGFSKACSECQGEMLSCLTDKCPGVCTEEGFAADEGAACFECLFGTCGEEFTACYGDPDSLQ